MNAAPKISVMVPTYNSSEFIGTALTSILEQDYQNVEIVVSDDASRDGTQEVLRAFKESHPEKIVLRLNDQNVGIAANCNKCLALCSGEFISLFAGDDVMLPGKLSKQAELFALSPDTVMVYHPVEIFDSETNTTIAITNRSAREDTNSASEIIMKMGIAGGMSLMVRKSALPAGGYLERLPYASDWLFHIEIAMQGKVRKLDEVLCRYRKYGSNNGKNLASYLHEFEQVLTIVEERYGDKPGIVDACRIGRARFLAGEGFRQLAVDRRNARLLFRRAVALQPRAIKYYLAYLAATNVATATLLPHLKYQLKRWLP